jgi:HK97 gp10 family phage protein
MAARPKVVVTGLAAIDRKLRLLPYKIQGKAVRPAIRAGMRFMQQRVQGEVPVDTGATRAKTKLRVTPKKLIKKGQRSSTIAMEVTIEAVPPLKKTSKSGTVFYPAIVEYGSKNQPANPFGHRAFNKYGDAARRITIAELKSGVDKAISSL